MVKGKPRSLILGHPDEKFMRQKVTIERKAELLDETNSVYQEWEFICSCWAQPTDDGDGMTIRYRDDIGPGMKLTTCTTVFIIGSVLEVFDGKIHLLKLKFSSARGVYARARTAPKPNGAPGGQHVKPLSDQGE